MLGFAQRFVASSWAPWVLLAVTGVLHVLATLAGGDPFLMVDLAVYVDGARHLTDGTLYDFFSEPLHLPFTYPTFSAIIFTPMTWLPWTVLRVLWQLASFGAIGLMAYATLRLLGRAGPKASRPMRQRPGHRRHHHRPWSLAGTGPHHLQLRPDQPVPVRAAAGRCDRRQGMDVRRIGRYRGRGETDPGHHRAVLPAAEALVRGDLVGRVLRRHGGRRRCAAAERDLAVLHQTDARSRADRAGLVGDQPVPAWRAGPARSVRI